MVKRGIRDGVHGVEDKHVSHAYIAYKDLQLSLPCLSSKLQLDPYVGHNS
jgi:hypothetical protein